MTATTTAMASDASASGVDDVVVEILAAPINGADFLFAAGWFGVQPQIPAAMGAEGVGRVVEVGSQADPALADRGSVKFQHNDSLATFQRGDCHD